MSKQPAQKGATPTTSFVIVWFQLPINNWHKRNRLNRLETVRNRNRPEHDSSLILVNLNHRIEGFGPAQGRVYVKVSILKMIVWIVTGFYGFPEKNKRRESWELLKNLSVKFELPWYCIGDYNDLLTQSEKKGNLMHPNYLIQGFREVVEYCDLLDLGMEGYPFTWERSRGSTN